MKVFYSIACQASFRVGENNVVKMGGVLGVLRSVVVWDLDA